MNSRLVRSLGSLLLVAGCKTTDGAEPAPPVPDGETIVTVAGPAESTAPEAASEESAAESARTVPAGYRPEFHPAARGLIERMEEGLKPLESIPSKPGHEPG